MKLKQVIDMAEPITDLIEQKLPFQTAYKISKIAEAVESNQKFWQSKLQQIFNQYATPDENGEKRIEPAQREVFNEQAKQLGEVEVDDIQTLLTFSDLEGVELTPREVFLLKPIITE